MVQRKISSGTKKRLAVVQRKISSSTISTMRLAGVKKKLVVQRKISRDTKKA